MKIHGLQKMTLLDFPEHVACTVFLNGCDLRCPFCHNFDLAAGKALPLMDEDELIRFLRKRRGLLDGVAFTGGEPCLHKDLPELMSRIKSMGFAIKLDTNGLHPEMLKNLLEMNLIDYAAMDIKNSPAKYALTCGVDEVDLEAVNKSISLLMSSGTEHEFRTTAVKEFHEVSDFEEIARLIKGAGRYFIQRFEDKESVPFAGLSSPSESDLNAFLKAARAYVPNASLRGV